jgi:hypothetical protein
MLLRRSPNVWVTRNNVCPFQIIESPLNDLAIANLYLLNYRHKWVAITLRQKYNPAD